MHSVIPLHYLHQYLIDAGAVDVFGGDKEFHCGLALGSRRRHFLRNLLLYHGCQSQSLAEISTSEDQSCCFVARKVGFCTELPRIHLTRDTDKTSSSSFVAHSRQLISNRACEKRYSSRM